MSKNKIIALQWLRGHCDVTGNEKASAKKATLLSQKLETTVSRIFKDHSLEDNKVDERPNDQRLTIRISQRLLTDTIANTPYCASSEAVTKFHVNCGRDFLAKLLYHIGLFDCTLCDQRQCFAHHLLLMCTALSSKA